MKQLLNVAVFGFSLNVLEQLKSQILQCLPKGVNVDWVNISEQKIDLLLVNDIFYSATNIQKVIQHQSSAYLRLIKDLDRTGQIEADVLHYPVFQHDALSEWLQSTFFDYEPMPVLPLNVAKQPMSQELRYVFKEMFVARNGFIKLYDQAGFLALVDCMTERVWVESRDELVAFNAQLNHTYATGQFVNGMIKDRHAQDLRAWLWGNFAHHSLEIDKKYKQQYFRLDVWPQFQLGIQRRDQMKMAACFALGANLKDVSEHLSLPIEQVEQFVAHAELMQFGHMIQAIDAKFIVKAQENEKSASQSIRKFFGKLRKKIGL